MRVRSGQALAEWALSAFVLLLLALGILAVGQVVGEDMAIRPGATQAAFAAARAPRAQAADREGLPTPAMTACRRSARCPKVPERRRKTPATTARFDAFSLSLSSRSMAALRATRWRTPIRNALPIGSSTIGIMYNPIEDE